MTPSTTPSTRSGFLVPRTEGRFVTACSFATTKWAHLGAADPATVVLRASAGRYGDDRAIDLDDDAVVRAVLADLDDWLGLGADPIEVRVSRWRDGFPQYEPGHLARVAAVEADVAAQLPGVALAGAAYRGIGIPACIRQGRQASPASWWDHRRDAPHAHRRRCCRRPRRRRRMRLVGPTLVPGRRMAPVPTAEA